MLLHCRQLVLHQVGITQLRQIAGTVEHVLGKSPARVLRVAGRALAVNAMLGPAQVRQRRKVQLAQRVLQLGPCRRVHVLLVQHRVQLRHEAPAHGIAPSHKLLAQNHLANFVALRRWERQQHLLARRLAFVHRLGPADVRHLAIRPRRHHHILPKARQREIHPLHRLVKLVIHLRQQRRLARAFEFTALDPLLDRLQHAFVVRLVGIPRAQVHLLCLGRQVIEALAQHAVLNGVVASHQRLGGVHLRQRGIVHQLGQLALIRQLRPGRSQCIRLGPHLVLIRLHLLRQAAVLIQWQRVAVNVHQLPTAQELQAQPKVVGQLEPGPLLDVGGGDALE